jgi:hypothetical protein
MRQAMRQFLMAPDGRHARDFVTALALWLADLDRCFLFRALLNHASNTPSLRQRSQSQRVRSLVLPRCARPVGRTMPKGRVMVVLRNEKQIS